MAWAVPLYCLLGCSSFFQERFQEPDFDIRGRRIIVVPLATKDRWYYEAADGLEFARVLSAQITRECDRVKILTGAEIDRAIADATEEQVPWTRIGNRFKADVIVFGEIRRLFVSERATIGTLQGNLNFDLNVWNVNKNESGFQGNFNVIFPKDVEKGDIAVSLEQTPREFRQRLLLQAAREVQVRLCGEYVDIR
jgi:hypothetical protein